MNKDAHSNNYILEHCVEKLARLNRSDYAIGFLVKSQFSPYIVDFETKAIVAPVTLFAPIKDDITAHLTQNFFKNTCSMEDKFYQKLNNEFDERFKDYQYIENLRYIPIGEGNILYAVVVLVNVDLTFGQTNLVDVAPFLSATVTLLKNQKQNLHTKSVRPVEGPIQTQNQSIVESMLQNTFHPTFIFNEEFKVLKANSASQRLFNGNIKRGWPSIERLVNRTLPSIAYPLLSSISKFFFLGHLEKNKWKNISLVLNTYQTIKVDIHLFEITYFQKQCFGLMINEKVTTDSDDAYNKSLQRFNALTSVIPMAILQLDKDFNCSYVNETWRKYTGQVYEESIDKGWLSALVVLDIKKTLSEILRIVSLSKSYKGEVQLTNIYQKTIWVSINGVGLFNDKYELTGIIITMYDISEERKQSEKLHKMANYDHLTGLSNRAFFTDRLSVALARVRRHGITSLMFLDLDRFKNINDTLGHPVGDQVIQEVAKRLKSTVRDEDSIARLGGDEFAIIFTDVTTEKVLIPIASKIVNSINVPFTINNQTMSLSCSIGIAIAENKNIESTEIIKKADLALYKAKESGRDRFCFYDESLEKNVSLLNSFRDSLSDSTVKGFSLVFHPLMNANADEVHGFEVLSRWSTNPIDDVEPEVFIKILEENGLIQNFTHWLFQSVIKQVKCWLEDGLLIKPQRIAINLSTKELHLVEFAENLIVLFEKEDISPSWFTLEVTEASFVQDPAIAGENLRKLKEAGFLIALDDFGTGYSSLGLLRKMPLDIIKVDKSFIKDILNDHETEKIVLAIIGLAKMLELEVIAEGVENIATKQWLIAQGCFYQQGFYFSKPLKNNKALDLLNTKLSDPNNVIELVKATDIK